MQYCTISELGFLVVRSSTADEKDNEGAISAGASASFLVCMTSSWKRSES